ncbi:hypothetical protein [Pontixanthobacter luteolus]|uniref:hypothetical protein n=1 Tax=Pontixanthobacter luteolus TaxID=295089 RepID=UPI002302DED7|nr:hypothetical protein [Pontixanthobacter luteolus]
MLTSDHRPIVRVTENDLLAAMQILACIARPHNQGKLEAGGKLLQAWFFARKRFRGEPTPGLDFLHPKSFQRSRIEPKLKTFSEDLWKAFEAARWLQAIILSSARDQHCWFQGFSHVTLRSLAANKWNTAPNRQAGFQSGELTETIPEEDDAGNIRKSIWWKRRPIVHMALAAANEIAQAAIDREQPTERQKRLEAKMRAISQNRERAANDSTAIAEWNKLSKAVSQERRNASKPIDLEAIVFDPVWVAPALEQAEEWARTIERQNLVSGVPLWRFVR